MIGFLCKKCYERNFGINWVYLNMDWVLDNIKGFLLIFLGVIIYVVVICNYVEYFYFLEIFIEVFRSKKL